MGQERFPCLVGWSLLFGAAIFGLEDLEKWRPARASFNQFTLPLPVPSVRSRCLLEANLDTARQARSPLPLWVTTSELNITPRIFGNMIVAL
jgi:hypothetical protein